ncbi:MAG: hypothetical protein IJW62_07490 [Clostridia bacterium]|nr:hypothetical protein [Clostridia bacterium]
MKKLSLALALVMALGAFASCADQTANTTTDAGANNPAATTPAATTTGSKITLPPLPSTDEPVSGEPGTDELPYEVEAFPNATCGDLALEGYEAWGYWEDGVNTEGWGMFVFTNDTMASGKLTATFTGVEGSPSDSGIVFGMEEDLDEMYWYWENGPAYYMLFVADAGTLYLSKVNYNGSPWTICEVTADPIPGFVHGQQVTITTEFDGTGNIKCYANGELLIDYTDTAPLTGNRYGVRAEITDVTYASVVAEHN